MDYSSNHTMLDFARAYAFAIDQINGETCNDPDVIKAFCKDKGNCIQWREMEHQQTWTRPRNYTDIECQNDEDCRVNAETGLQPQCRFNEELGKKVCAFAPEVGKDMYTAGTCEIVSQAKCEEFSALPYECDKDNFFCTLKDDPDIRYFEWHRTDAIKCNDETTPCTGSQSKCLPTGECTCLTDNDCAGTATCQASTTPGQKVCRGGGRCVFGNYALRQWCENPKSRCQPVAKPNAPDCTTDSNCVAPARCVNDKCVSPADFPEDCRADVGTNAFTPPFAYDAGSGRCFMSKPYCDKFIQDFVNTDGRTCVHQPDCNLASDTRLGKVNRVFISDIQCTKNNCTSAAKKCTTRAECASDEICHAGYCTGPRSQCGNTLGGEFLGMNLIDMTVGRTMYKSIFENPYWGATPAQWAKGFDCRERYEPLENLLLPSLNNIPRTIRQLVDDRMVYDKQVISRMYVDGVKLYLIIWTDATIKPVLGFLQSELKQQFSHILREVNGRWYVDMTWKKLKKDDTALKRIYIMCAMGEKIVGGDWMDFIMSMVTPDEKEIIDRIIKSYNE